ncbi:MAG: hypothetical protein H6740_10865 [Alphaproteobacteria bacterium]|nr:hypothetical protein [Alphaproteobacteria bacterium]
MSALSARRAGTLAAITVGAPLSVAKERVVRALRQTLDAKLAERVTIQVDEGMDGGLELMSLEFTWCR